MSFWGSIFGGSNPTLDKNIAQAGQTSGWATGQGESDVSAGTGFMKSILSGDSSKQMQALSPEISAARTTASQDNKKNAEFGTRSGGTAASSAATDDKTHSEITNLLGSLTGSAASGLTSEGSNLMNQGMEAAGQQVQFSQQQMQNWGHSILGQFTHQATGTF
jgi:hypothetical protein